MSLLRMSRRDAHNPPEHIGLNRALVMMVLALGPSFLLV